MFEDIKNDIKNGGALTKLIAAMVIIFIGLNVLPMLLGLGIQTDNFIQNYLAFPSSFSRFIIHPWTIITYAFLHADSMHILFNMLIFYVSGNILQGMIGKKHILPLFILGAIAGAILYMLAYNIFPFFRADIDFATLIGASAGVMATLIAATIITPELPINFIMVRLQLKYVALIFVLIDLMSMAGGNAGGHFSHLGGALFGYVYIKQLQNGFNISSWFQFDFSKFKNKEKFQVHRNEKPIVKSDSNELELNRILDKISATGISSLTDSEKTFLEKFGNK
jgi:membrane associated rhomboid family serine protease